MKRQGFTLVEILASIVIIGILTTVVSVSYNRAWMNSQTDTCESELRDMSNAFSSFFMDYGNIVIKPDDHYEAVLEDILEILNKQYLPHHIEVTEIAPDKKSVKLTTSVKTDPFGNKYSFDIYTYGGDDRDSVAGLVLIHSKGADGKSNLTKYKDGDYGDDAISVVEPKQ